jgi:hypothetical protein
VLYCWAAALLLPPALNHLWKSDLARPRNIAAAALLAAGWWMRGPIVASLPQLAATLQAMPLAAFFSRTFQGALSS